MVENLSIIFQSSSIAKGTQSVIKSKTFKFQIKNFNFLVGWLFVHGSFVSDGVESGSN